MNQVKVQVDKYLAGEGTVQEIVDAAKAGSGKPATAAEVIRDSEGKIVEVRVNLPEADNAGLLNAAAKIAENSKVATTGTKEQFMFDFNDLTPDDPIGSSYTNSDGYTLQIGYSNPGAFSALEAGSAAQSQGGSGSCLRITPKTVTLFHSNNLELSFDVASNPTGWSQATDWEVNMHLSSEHDPGVSSADLKVASIEPAGKGASGVLIKSNLGFGGVSDPTEYAYSLSTQTISVGGTGITGTDYIKFTMRQNAVGAVELLCNDVLQASGLNVSTLATSNLGITAQMFVNYAAAALHKPMFVDSIDFNINDGTLGGGV
jgi:hypothetical protein